MEKSHLDKMSVILSQLKRNEAMMWIVKCDLTKPVKGNPNSISIVILSSSKGCCRNECWLVVLESCQKFLQDTTRTELNFDQTEANL